MTFTPGTTLSPWLRPGLEMRPSPIGGRGLFALDPIRAGEVVVVWGGQVFTRQDILDGKANPESIAILDEGLYLADPVDGPSPEDYAVNHACDSNLWMQDAITLAARRDITPGEELTADYALWLYDFDWFMEPCNCGSALCRGRVTGQDWQLPDLQARYAGHFTPLINHLIRR